MADNRPSIADKRRAFHELHKAGCFVIPGAFMRAARLLAEQGRFDGLADAASGRELNSLFGR